MDAELIGEDASTKKTLVLGIGNVWRGDDAVGLLAARALHARRLPGVTVVEASTVDPSLIARWQGYDRLVLIDAVVSGAAVGSVHRFDLSQAPFPTDLFCCSTHSFNLATLIELARTLRRLPPQVWLFGIEVHALNHGRPVSAEVRAGLANCIDRIIESLQV